MKPEGRSSSEDDVVEEEEENEIPYVFDACPSTSDELRELVNSVSATSGGHRKVVRRIACCHAPALGDAAKYEALSGLYVVLLWMRATISVLVMVPQNEVGASS